MSSHSPFLDISPDEYVASNGSAFAIYDRFPVSEGHVLVISRRLISTWWDATRQEQADVMELVAQVKGVLDSRFSPAGYNVGFNAGDAAGQTVPHLHVHVIPRYRGDVYDPRGGVRHVIPGRGNYLSGMVEDEAREGLDLASVELFDEKNGRLLIDLKASLRDPTFDHVDLAVSFIRMSGLKLIEEPLIDCLQRSSRVRILTTDYLGYTEPAALHRLLDLAQETGNQLSVKVFHDPKTSFHPKAYLFWSSAGSEPQVIVGSSNLTRSALEGGVEWNLSARSPGTALESFDSLWNDVRNIPLTEEWLKSYNPEQIKRNIVAEAIQEESAQPAEPRPIQAEALKSLEQTRINGFRAGLVVMATGLGKTWLAAFDSTSPNFDRILFVAHREEILKQSRYVFRQVHPDGDLGLYYGKESSPRARVVFASIQTLQRNLSEFSPDDFDYVVVDEFHHASAPSYRKVIDYFEPKFLLGLTATPERMDGADLLALCDDNLVFDCGLVEGIDRSELVPFHYWGVPDPVDFEPIPWRGGRFAPEELEKAIETTERSERAFEEWKKRAGGRTLAFCASTHHADFMDRYFRGRGVKCASVHSKDTSAPRLESLEDLRNGVIQVVFAVDLFNEGLDMPEIDTVLMLRPTESPIIFLQQLGRGLRTREGKAHLEVVDFIGNHKSFLSVPRTLLSLGSNRPPSGQLVMAAIESGDFGLPDGCSVSYELEAVEMLKSFQEKSRGTSALADYCLSYFEEEGTRPSATQAFHAGNDLSGVRKKSGSWFEFLADHGLLSEREAEIHQSTAKALAALEAEPITGPHKLITFRALLHEGALRSGLGIPRIAEVSRQIVERDPRLVKAIESKEFPNIKSAEATAWEDYWRRWPISRLTDTSKSSERLVRVEEDQLVPNFTVTEDLGDVFDAMAAELVEYRLSKFLTGKESRESTSLRLKVSHAEGTPLILLNRNANKSLPEGEHDLSIEDIRHRVTLTKGSISNAIRADRSGNALPSILRGWFGPSAGQPGTNHFVVVEIAGESMTLRPDSALEDRLAEVVPLFPSFEVACGDFPPSQWMSHGGVPLELLWDPKVAKLDPSRQFVCFARGDSMEGGTDPIEDGDPLLLEWVGSGTRSDYLGQRVLVSHSDGDGTSATLKTLRRSETGYQLEPANPEYRPIAASSNMKIVARLQQRLSEVDINPVASRIGELYKRSDVPPLYEAEFNPGNWNSGHVSFDNKAILFVTLDKGSGMEAGADYVDHFESPKRFVWSSQTSTGPDGKKGREILGSPGNGVAIDLWVRRKKTDVAFIYLGRLVPLGHTGDRPMSVTFRMLTPVDGATWDRLHR